MHRIRATEKASQAQQGMIVTVSEPELLLCRHDRAQRRLPAGHDRQGNEATVVHRTRTVEAIGDASIPSRYADFRQKPRMGSRQGTSLSSRDCGVTCNSGYMIADNASRPTKRHMKKQ